MINSKYKIHFSRVPIRSSRDEFERLNFTHGTDFTLYYYSCADWMASARTADLNPFIIVSFSSRIWLQRPTIHWACNGLMSKSLADTLTFESSVWRARWADACFECQLSHLPEINVIVIPWFGIIDRNDLNWFTEGFRHYRS